MGERGDRFERMTWKRRGETDVQEERDKDKLIEDKE